MKPLFFVLILCFLSASITAQEDSTINRKLDFSGDFRFRIEQDWNARKSDGTYSEDRSRLRYRFRFGLNYSIDKHSSFGGRIRSGNINDQQGPHITLGGNGKGEFGLVQIGFEKLFYKYESKKLIGWIGKNSIPLKKLHELFWNDNVFPEGVGLKYKFVDNGNKLFSHLTFNTGHFIIKSNNQSFAKDSYLQIFQFDLKLFQNKLNLFPGFYAFRNIGNFPDAQQTYFLNYSIFHIGVDLSLLKKSHLNVGLELYNNFTDYSNHESILTPFKDQKNGFVVTLKYGKLEKKGDWTVQLFYARMQKFAIVDYFAQNDWARWDYSSIGASGARISNFHGSEIQVGYAFKEKFNLILRTYFVEQLVKVGDFKENGNRIRLDLNIGF